MPPKEFRKNKFKPYRRYNPEDRFRFYFTVCFFGILQLGPALTAAPRGFAGRVLRPGVSPLTFGEPPLQGFASARPVAARIDPFLQSLAGR